jgi:hypothetical protein
MVDHRPFGRPGVAMTTVFVVGNPRAGSRTRQLAEAVAAAVLARLARLFAR